MPSQAASTASQCVQTIKFLAADAVERARSGHPGAPMGMADMAFVLWTEFLRFDPADPEWRGRDRFVLSAGHASMLLYALLHLFGFDLPLEELRRFRQWGSRTPGHPEHGVAPGVEATTGPLGQGFGNGVGLALAEKMLLARVPEAAAWHEPRIFALVSDGDLMEGVASEAASLAGHWGLGNLVYLYDDNRVSIEGPTGIAFCEEVGERFEAYGWHVQRVDGHDHAAVREAIAAGVAERERPSILLARTLIGKGAPTKQGTAQTHGEPLGSEELRRAKEAAGWPLDPPFLVPEEVRAFFRDRAEEKRRVREIWDGDEAAFRRSSPEAAERWDALWSRAVPADLQARLLSVASGEGLATRKHSGRTIQAAAALIPSLVGGSADLAPSTSTTIEGGGHVAPAEFRCGAPVVYTGRTLHFGVREHAMGAIVNGLALHGAFLPFGATFLVFSDYMRPAIRLAALSRLRSIFVFTHDSVFLGEDGPTHQPIEQAASLRLIPNLHVWRPGDGLETAAAWAGALCRVRGPSVLLLTRQNLAPLTRPAGFDSALPARGGYVLAESEEGPPDITLVATGSEVPLAAAARERLAGRGVRARVVSMPCVERFLEEPASYRDSVLPRGGRFAVIEAGRLDGWFSLLGSNLLPIGLDRFGASAPGEVIARQLGFTPDGVAERTLAWMGRS
ncbi:MAG TPA: transketolase [Candidatus Eisenbacteria bacterium]